MTDADDAYRYARQIRLREVGEDGQRAIASSHVRLVTVGLAGQIERRYLEAAGVRHFDGVVDPGHQPRVVPEPVMRIEGPVGDIARGAFAALTTLVSVIHAGERNP